MRNAQDAHNDEHADAAWDDDDFELPQLRQLTVNPTATAATVTTCCIALEHQDETEDGWLTQTRTSQATPHVKSNVNWRGSSVQARVLNTPASQKRRRCVECTRPLADGPPREENLCARCAADK